MRKFLLIACLVVIFFIAEFCLFNLIGRWMVPQMLLLLIVFFDAYWGIRYGLLTAALAGLIKDSFSINIYGENFWAFIVCAYLATVLRKYLYHVNSDSQRIMLVGLLIIANFLLQYLARVFMGLNDLKTGIVYILLPQLVLSLLITNPFFYHLKRCVRRLFI